MELFIERIRKLLNETEEIYIYGAGLYGQRVYNILQKNGILIRGFVVTNDVECNRSIFDLPVQRIEEINFKNAGIIVSANRHNSIEILNHLKHMSHNEEKIICACEYLDKRKVEESYYDMPTIEVTTVIGCKINCRYCPQKLLLKHYFRDNPQRDSIMTLDTFMMCLNHLPEKCNIQFCGMSEPFLNPLCVDMICKTCESGRSIELYTTLVGLTQKGLEKILELPIDFVNIHVADVNGYADIPVTEEHFELVNKVINHKRQDGSYFVNLCNAQGEPHPRIKKMCEGKFDISTSLHDRAGNLQSENLLHKQNESGILSCTLCGQDLNHNVLLPDGTLLLCCMDYGMKHVLGNLRKETYEEIMTGEHINRIKEGLLGDEKIDILCRMCSNATRIN